ncbi:hypothetical protein FL622_06060 [Desulfuromonas acetexigens]|uniref:Protein kinase domain-containing protein n=1 Tax=Trichloromonas acetexigens TaxID=38815 RepID=A0A550JHQ6_9BACT|nr:hypothetical protein FL622_06060 [Desulfuromonas acetexigens]
MTGSLGKSLKIILEPAPEVCEIHGPFRVFQRNNRSVTDLLDGLLPDPDQVIAGGEVFKEGSRNHSVRVELAGLPYFLKRYNCRGWGYRLGNLLRQSRAVRTWRVHLEFLRRGIPIQDPLLCLEERKFRLLGRSYLLTGFVEGASSLMELWPTLTVEEKPSLLRCLAEQLGHMHRFAALHGDLKWYNILIRCEAATWQPKLVDLDGSRVLRRVSARKAREDIGRFLRDLEAHESDPRLKTLFEEIWRERAGLE